jgi:hypothetical protein
MKYTIATRAFDGPLYQKFLQTLPKSADVTFMPLFNFDGFEGAFDFLLAALQRTEGRLIICDLDCFVYKWEHLAELIEDERDWVVSERAIAHRQRLPRYVGNPFFWILDADRAKKTLPRITTSPKQKERIRKLYTMPGDAVDEPFWGLYYWLYYVQKLPVATIPVTEHPDGITTQSAYFAHTWYSRDYGHCPIQTARIDNILDFLPWKSIL